MSGEEKTNSSVAKQDKNDPKLAEKIEENTKKAFKSKGSTTGRNEGSKHNDLNRPSNISTPCASTSQKLKLSGDRNQDPSVIIRSSISPNDQSILIDLILFDQSIFDTFNLTGNSTAIDKFDCSLVSTFTPDCKEQFDFSESSDISYISD